LLTALEVNSDAELYNQIDGGAPKYIDPEIYPVLRHSGAGRLPSTFCNLSR
jgi:hypothetical protein